MGALNVVAETGTASIMATDRKTPWAARTQAVSISDVMLVSVIVHHVRPTATGNVSEID